MPLVFYRCEYFALGEDNRLHLHNRLTYNGTREGVALLRRDETPERSPLPLRTGTVMEDPHQYLSYIGERKGVETLPANVSQEIPSNTHGLFNADGVCDMTKEHELLEQHADSIIWCPVISLAKKHAEELGLTDAEAWRQMLVRIMPRIAKLYGISQENLVWNAAYHPVDKHGRDHHPHVHIYMYSKDPSEGIMAKKRTRQVLEKCRSLLTHDLFPEEMKLLEQQQQEARGQLEALVKEKLPSLDALLPELRELQSMLPDKGRLYYGYCNQKVKAKVDDIVRHLTEQPMLGEAFNELRYAQGSLIRVYIHDDATVQERLDKWEKDFFHPVGRSGTRTTHTRAVLHNLVLQTAAALLPVPLYVSTEDIPLPEEAPPLPGEDEVVRVPQAEPEIPLYRFRDLDEAMQEELQWAVGLNPQPNAYTRDLLARVEGGDGNMSRKDMWRLLYGAEQENLREIRAKAYSIYRYEDSEFRQQLKDEVRLDLPKEEQPFENAADSLHYYSGSLASQYEKIPSVEAQTKVRDLFIDFAAGDRLWGRLSAVADLPELRELETVVGIGRLRLDKLPENVQEPLRRAMVAVSLQDEELAAAMGYPRETMEELERYEAALAAAEPNTANAVVLQSTVENLKVRVVEEAAAFYAFGDAKNTSDERERVLDGLLSHVRYRVLRQNVRAAQTEIFRRCGAQRDELRALAATVTCQTKLEALPPEQVRMAERLIGGDLLSNADERARDVMRDTVLAAARSERIRQLVRENVLLSQAIRSATKPLRLSTDTVHTAYGDLTDAQRDQLQEAADTLAKEIPNDELRDYAAAEPEDWPRQVYRMAQNAEYEQQHLHSMGHGTLLGLLTMTEATMRLVQQRGQALNRQPSRLPKKSRRGKRQDQEQEQQVDPYMMD